MRRLKGPCANEWHDPEGEVIESCTILTTEANELVRPLHNRMLVILPREDNARWLDANLQDRASGINDSGQIVGGYYDYKQENHGFLRDVDGTYTTLDVPRGTIYGASGINNSGQIVGSYIAIYDYGFLRDVDGTYTTLDVVGFDTFANGINDSGQIVGRYAGDRSHGFLATPRFDHPDWPGGGCPEMRWLRR
jgi:hypothetical protein